MQPFCKVRQCRFPRSHTTSGHQCGTCRGWGHGQLECRHGRLRRHLLPSLSDVLPASLRCTVPHCASSAHHTTSAHVCEVCGSRGGHCECCVDDGAGVAPGHAAPAFDPAGALPGAPAAQQVRACPLCRAHGPVDLTRLLFTGADCVVCLQGKPLVAFACNHVVVCAECAAQL